MSQAEQVLYQAIDDGAFDGSPVWVVRRFPNQTPR